MAKILSLVVFVIFLNGCTPWPKHSTGGYASKYIFTPGYQKSLFKNNYPYIMSKHLFILTKQTYRLRQSHAVRCHPARLKLLLRLGERIAQEIDSGLLLGARKDLVLYENNLADIRKLNQYKGCPRPKTNLNWEYLKSRDQG